MMWYKNPWVTKPSTELAGVLRFRGQAWVPHKEAHYLGSTRDGLLGEVTGRTAYCHGASVDFVPKQ